MILDFKVYDSLRRRLIVQLTEQRLKNDVINRLAVTGNKYEAMDIPVNTDVLQVLEQQLGREAQQKVFNEMIQSSFEEAINQLQLNVAGKPDFEIIKSESAHNFIYKADFDVYPDINIPDLKTFKFQRLVAEVSEEDVDHTILTLRRQQAEWRPVDRPAQTGDSVIINYFAQRGDRVFDGKEMRVELNGDDVVAGFENYLTGVSAAEKLSLPLKFPDDYFQNDVAGKTVNFDVEVVRVEAMTLPELDENFIKSQGIKDGSVSTFYNTVQHNMNAHLQKTIRMKNMLNLLTDILSRQPVEVPQALLKEEVARLTRDPCEEVEGVENFKHEMDHARFTRLAYNRVARSLLVSELARAYDIKLDTDQVKERLQNLVEEYSETERIIEWFYEDRTRLAGIESDVLGEQVADWIMENTQADTVATTYREMMRFD